MREVRPGTAVWDVGGFIGYHTLLFSRLAGAANVVVLEPDPTNLARLVRHIEMNRAGQTSIIEAAAGSRAGQAKIVPDLVHPSQSTVIPSEDGECVVVTLDSLLEERQPPEVIKVDVEGAEMEVLRGAQTVLSRIRPLWLIEVHSETLAKDCIRLLETYDYSVFTLDDTGPKRVDLRSVTGPGHLLARPTTQASSQSNLIASMFHSGR